MMYLVSWVDEYSHWQSCKFYRLENALALLKYFYENSDVHIFELKTLTR